MNSSNSSIPAGLSHAGIGAAMSLHISRRFGSTRALASKAILSSTRLSSDLSSSAEVFTAGNSKEAGPFATNGCVVGTLKDFFVALGFSNFKSILIKAFHSLEPFRRLWKLDCKVTFILGGNFFQPTPGPSGTYSKSNTVDRTYCTVYRS
jgi:hypothetical protein